MKNFYVLVLTLCFLLTGITVDAQVEQSGYPAGETTPPVSNVTVEHDPVTAALEYEPILLSVNITGWQEGDKATLHFREKGETDFYALPLGINPATGMYETTIDERYHSDEVLEYYIDIFLMKSGRRIRIPETWDSYYTIKSYKSFDKYVRGILYVLLIAAPGLIYYLWNRLYKTHVHRTTMYQQKLNKRRRHLSKQREKHYQEYLQKLSGLRKPNQMKNRVSGKSIKAPAEKTAVKPEESQKKPAAGAQPSAIKSPPPVPTVSEDVEIDDRVSTSELKRELDEILNIRSREEDDVPAKSPVKSSPRPSAPTKKKPVEPELSATKPGVKLPEQTKPKVSKVTDDSPVKVTPDKPKVQEPSIKPGKKQMEETEQDMVVKELLEDDIFEIEDDLFDDEEEVEILPETPVKPSAKKPVDPSVKKSESPVEKPQTKPKSKPPKDKDSLEKSERDQLLDILGLDI